MKLNASGLSNIDVWLTIEGYIWEKKLDVNKFYDFSYKKYTLNRQADNILKWKYCVKMMLLLKMCLIFLCLHIYTQRKIIRFPKDQWKIICQLQPIS